jgi:hypothetical protein
MKLKIEKLLAVATIESDPTVADILSLYLVGSAFGKKFGKNSGKI